MTRLLSRLSARAIGALVATITLIVGLHGLARLGLRGPTGISRDELTTWFDDPISAIATILRWLALVLSYYLAAVLVAVIATRNQVDRSSLRFVIPNRLATAVGLFIGVGAVTVPLVGHLATTPAPLGSAGVDELTLVQLDDSLTLLQLEPLAEAERPHAPMPDTGPVGTQNVLNRVDVDHSWTVAPGDSFWAIAHEHLEDAWGRAVTDPEIVTYWERLIEANTSRLVEPGNPDLLYPGQVLTLPEVPPRQE